MDSKFGSSLLGNSPQWLKKWTAITLREVFEEYRQIKANLEAQLPLKFTGEVLADKELFYNIESQNMLDMRIQNLAISLDKVNIFLSKSSNPEIRNSNSRCLKKEGNNKKTRKVKIGPTDFKLSFTTSDEASNKSEDKEAFDSSAPFALINIKEDEEMYWSKEKDSFRSILTRFVALASSKSTEKKEKETLSDLSSFLKLRPDQLRSELCRGLEKNFGLVPSKTDELLPVSTPLKEVWRKALVYLSFRLREVKLKEFHPAIPDLLYLLAFTTFIFRSQTFNAFDQMIDIRECDLTMFEKYLQNSALRIEDESKVIHTQTK